MLVKRAISAVVIIAICLALIYAGGWIFAIGVGIILAIAAREYAGIFEKGGYAPAKIFLCAGTFLTTIAGYFQNEIYTESAFGFLISGIIIYHVAVYKQHQKTSAFDLAISLGGVAFIAYMGSFLIKLRFLPDGLFWVTLSILPAGLSDIGAFFIGRSLGRHKIAPELSPNKTIEGYIGGVFTSLVSGYALGLIFSKFNPLFNGWQGLLIGFIVGVICPVGDFAKSIFKRQFGLKNCGTLIPGHGGVLDRIDTWLWAGITGYFLIQYIFI